MTQDAAAVADAGAGSVVCRAVTSATAGSNVLGHESASKDPAMAETANPEVHADRPPLARRTEQVEATPLARRRLVAGGAALAGSAVATLLSAEPASAGHDTNIAYDSQTTMHLDVVNTTASSTRISTNISGTAAFVVLNNYPVGISRPDGMLGRTTYTTSNCAGVAGSCEAAAGGIGVLGTANNPTGTGVYAYSGSNVPFVTAPPGTGLYANGGDNGIVALARNAGGLAGRFDGRVQSETLTLTRTAGVKAQERARKLMTVKDVPCTAGSVVIATLQEKVKGLRIVAAAADPVESKVRIYFNKTAPIGTRVGWIVVS